MLAREVRVLFSLSGESVVMFAAYGGERLDPRADAPASLEARSLEGRPLAMYHSLTLADRSRLRLSEPRPRLAHIRRTEATEPSVNERREHRTECGARVTTSPLSSRAQEMEAVRAW